MRQQKIYLRVYDKSILAQLQGACGHLSSIIELNVTNEFVNDIFFDKLAAAFNL